MKSGLPISGRSSATRRLRALEQVGRDRQQLAHGHLLRERRHERVVDDVHRVDVAVHVRLRHGVRDRLRVAVGGPLAEADPRLRDVHAAEAERRRRLAARRRWWRCTTAPNERERSGDAAERDAHQVRLDARPAGVAADGRHRRVFSVLRGHLGDAHRGDLLHPVSVGGAASRRARRRLRRPRGSPA